MKCKFCGYKWTTKSKLLSVVCPSCLKKNPNKTVLILKGEGTAKEIREKGMMGTTKEVEFKVGDEK